MEKSVVKGVMRPGQDLVAAGYSGLEGTVRIASEKRHELLKWFSPAYLAQLEQCRPLEKGRYYDGGTVDERLAHWQLFGATASKEIGEGGVLAALWHLSEAYRSGLVCFLDRIPLRQITVEICERYELNPYRLLSGDAAILAADNGGRLSERLSEAGIPAAVIGRVEQGIARRICHHQTLGYLERPKPDELEKALERASVTERLQ